MDNLKNSMLAVLQSKTHRLFFQNVGTLLTGRGAQHIITLLAIPFIARLFDPAHFGIAALFLAVSSTLGSVSTLRYERAVALPPKDPQGQALIWVCLAAFVVFCMGLLLIVAILLILDLEIPFANRLGKWMWLVPIAILCHALVNTAEMWLTRKKKFRTIAYSFPTESFLRVGSRLSFGTVFGSSVWALISGALIGLAAKVLVLYKSSSGMFSPKNEGRCWKELAKVAYQYKDFPIYNAPAHFVVRFAQSLPVLLLGYLYAPAIVGFYAMANRLVRLPIDMVAGAIHRTYLQRAAEIDSRKRSLQLSWLKLTAGLAAVGVVPFLAMWVIGEEVLVFILGDNWSTAGRYVEILTPWLYTALILSPSSTVMMVLRRQAMWLGIQVAVLLIRAGIFGMAFYISATPEWTIVVFVTASALANFGIILNTFFVIRTHEAERNA